MDYPDGSIKSLDELYDNAVVYGASRKFGIVDAGQSSLLLTVAHIYDYNVTKLNRYNDWFLFTDKIKAEIWAKV